jgi:hypothetical protein
MDGISKVKIGYYRIQIEKPLAVHMTTFPSILTFNANRVAFLTRNGSLACSNATFEVW